jgi:methyl-accepting chemotaxis protein
MSEDAFRIVVTAAVWLAAIVFVVQAVVVVMLYKVIRKTQESVTPLMARAETAIGKAQPAIERIGPLMDAVRPVVERVGPMMDTVKPVIAKAGGVIESTGPAVDRVTAILTTVHQTMEEMRPRIAEISTEAAAAVASAREQVERAGELLHDATGRARARLDQIDQTVDETVQQVEHVGENVKRAVMKPVREVNGIAAGIAAAIATLVYGSRRSSVSDATQDEEMFI